MGCRKSEISLKRCKIGYHILLQCDQGYYNGLIGIAYALSNGTKINDLWWPWTADTYLCGKDAFYGAHQNKKALLSQRRPRDAPNIWVSWKVSRVPRKRPRLLFPKYCKVLLFRSIQNLKFVALSVPEIIGGTQKIWAVPRYAHAPFSVKFLKGCCSDGPCEYTCQIWSS